jgi:ATP-dependent exoDNAse (exonuclease V) alpha subunit
MIRRLVLDGDGVAVVVGQAGTGKTYALAAARQAWEGSGYRVVGAALARRAAIELEDGAGIASRSVAALLEELRTRPWRALPRRSVLVIDEAGMVPTRALAEIVEHVERAGAKLVLVGDDRQLPEIGAGGTFGALARRLPAIESCARTGGRSPCGSGKRSRYCGTVMPRARCSDTRAAGESS